MKHMKTTPWRALVASSAILLGASLPASAELYKVASIAPGMSPFVVNTGIAKIVNSKLDGIDFQVRATGAATKHTIEAATGKVDFLFSSPALNWLMANQIGPYAKIDKSAEYEKNLGMIFSYQLGPYHYITRADSGIETVEDFEGKKVFLGPPGGGARNTLMTVMKQATGLTGEDMEVQPFGFDAAIQAFQDDKIDVIVLPTNVPSPSIQQFALTKEIRILGFPIDRMDIREDVGGTVNTVPAKAYGDNQIGDDVVTHGSLVNFSAGMHVDEEVVYQVTKAIWENLGTLHEVAQWMPSTITKETALQIIPGRLHPGAERYYREMGWEIPEAVDYSKSN
jgi:uncharacterized protein